MRLDYETALRDRLLVKVDRATMLASVEARAPFLDPSVTRAAFALPGSAHVRGLSTKRVLRRVARPENPVSRSPRNTRGRAKAFSVSDLRIRAGRVGVESANARPRGSDPPENGPCLRNRAFRRGRSWEFSLQEGGAPLGAQRGQPQASGPSFVSLGWRKPNLVSSLHALLVRPHGTQ